MGFERFVIDSSVFVAFYYAGDKHHENALELLGDLETKILIVHPYVIAETATVLAYKLGHKLAVNFLNDVENAANVIIPSVETSEDIKNFIRAGRKLSFTDITLVGLAQKIGAQLATFDSQMLSLSKRWST